MSLPAPRALLFDWDNTLVDTWVVIHHALKVTLAAMGHRPWTLEETRARVRASARDRFPILFGARADEAMEIFYRTFESDHLQTLREREGAGELLRELREKGIARVSLVGAGMKTHPGVAAQMFETLSGAGINIEMISTSAIRISCVVREAQAEAAVAALHAAFQLDRAPEDRADV